jgi:4-hydroxythreonine-4-phosphate dehydrogenase
VNRPAAPGPLAISLGDPAGVGPELIAESWHRRVSGVAPFAVIGGRTLLESAARSLGRIVPTVQIAELAEAPSVFSHALPVLGEADAPYTPGSPNQQGALLALASLSEATRLCVEGTAGGLVTGPISEAELARVGFTQPGQTEFVADACGVHRDSAVMMLAGPSLRTVPLTVHVALADVPRLVTRELIERKARIVVRALREDFGIAAPRLAVTGLNPHAGEAGRMGSEEIDVIGPAIEALRAQGLTITGPHPADALFTGRQRGTFDAALCMYHDQALIPIKTLDFDSGVNVTLGLPIVRTSPDHGTAFAIAGKGEADAGAMLAAIRMAGDCAARRAAAA